MSKAGHPSSYTSSRTQLECGLVNQCTIPQIWSNLKQLADVSSATFTSWRQFTSLNTRFHSAPTNFPSGFARFSSKSSLYQVKVGIPEFLKGVGKGVEAHVEKLETEIGDFQKLLVTRTLKLKKLEIPCKHRKLILKFAHKYRLGLWRPRVEPVKKA